MRLLPALLLALVAACSAPTARTAPVTPPAPAPEAAVPQAAPVEGEPILLDAGAEPRYQLRYRAPVGTLRTTSTEINLAMEMPGLVALTILPTMVYAGSLDVIEVTDDGSFTTRTTLDDADALYRPGADPATVETMTRSYDGLGELRFLMSFDARGKKLDERLEAGSQEARSDVVSQTKEATNDGMPRLPEQPVGKGARWRTTMQTISSGVEFDNDCEFEVVDVTATTMHLRSTVRMTAPRQSAEIGEASVVVEGSGTSAADLMLDLTTLIGDLTLRLDLALTLAIDENASQLRMSSDVSARWR